LDKILTRQYRLGAGLIGGELMSKYGGWPMFSKLYDLTTPLFHHFRLDMEAAARVGKLGKPECYYVCESPLCSASASRAPTNSMFRKLRHKGRGHQKRKSGRTARAAQEFQTHLRVSRMSATYIMAIDAGTGSVRVLIFNADGKQIGCAQRE
jgi:hypothetical protein